MTSRGYFFGANTVCTLFAHWSVTQVSAEWTACASDDAWIQQGNEHAMKGDPNIKTGFVLRLGDKAVGLKRLILVTWLLLFFLVNDKVFFPKSFLKEEMGGSQGFGKVILKWGARLLWRLEPELKKSSRMARKWDRYGITNISTIFILLQFKLSLNIRILCKVSLFVLTSVFLWRDRLKTNA